MVEPWEFPKYFDHRTSLSRVYLLTPAGSMEQTLRNAKTHTSPLHACIKHMIAHGILCNYSVPLQGKQSFFGPDNVSDTIFSFYPWVYTWMYIFLNKKLFLS